MSLKVKCFPRGMYAENTYIVTDEETGHMAVIDPGYFSEAVTSLVENKDMFKYILLTHGHNDHFSAAVQYTEAYPDAVFAVPEKERGLLYGSGEASDIGISDGNCPPASLFLKEGDVIKLGSTELKVIETPGHTAGGICFLTDNELFSGDTLFRLSVGRTDLATGDWDTLVDSIKNKLYVLDEDMKVYCGHGAATTIGFEKRANPFV